MKKSIYLLLILLSFSYLVSCDDNKDEIVETPSLSIGMPDGSAPPIKLYMNADGGSQKFAITSNGTWKIIKIGTDTDWLTVNPDEGSKNSEISISAAKNTDTDNREATLSFAVDGVEGVKTYTVSQLGFGPKLAVSPKEPEVVPYTGGDVTFFVTTNADDWEYSIADAPTWVTEKEKTATSLTLTVSQHTDESRLAVITFKLTNYPSVTQEITLVQAGDITKTITLGSPAAAASVDLSVTENITFSWEGVKIVNGYKLIVSNKNNLSTPLLTKETTATSSIISAYELDSKLDELAVALKAETDLYWSVQPLNNTEITSEAVEIRKITVKRKAVPTADMLDVVFNTDGTATDLSPMNHTVSKISYSYPFTISFNSTYNRNMVTFNPAQNGSDGGATGGSYYRVDYLNNASFNEKLANGHSFECLVKFDVDYTTNQSYETKFFSTHEGGGTGFMIANQDRGNGLTFLPNIPAANGGGSNWIWANSSVRPNGTSWYHLVGVWNQTNGKAYIYVNGEKKAEVNAAGFYRPTNSESIRWIGIGGDAGGNGAQGMFKGSLAIARIYDKPLTETEAQALWEQVN